MVVVVVVFFRAVCARARDEDSPHAAPPPHAGPWPGEGPPFSGTNGTPTSQATQWRVAERGLRPPTPVAPIPLSSKKRGRKMPLPRSRAQLPPRSSRPTPPSTLPFLTSKSDSRESGASLAGKGCWVWRGKGCAASRKMDGGGLGRRGREEGQTEPGRTSPPPGSASPPLLPSLFFTSLSRGTLVSTRLSRPGRAGEAGPS